MTHTQWADQLAGWLALSLAANLGGDASSRSGVGTANYLKPCLPDVADVLLGLPKDEGPGLWCASPCRRRNMDAEEERSAHKVLDPMVPCRQNGRIGKTGAAVLFFFKISPLCFVKFCVRWPLCLCVGTLRTLHRLLKTQNTLQIQSITRSECAGRSNPAWAEVPLFTRCH